jgi:hypothetical protein
LLALTVPPAEGTARAAGRRVGKAEVEILTEQVSHLRQLDCHYGSGRVREQVVSLLHREANQLLHASYSDKTGKTLLTAVAQATNLAGHTAADMGRHSLAQRYYIQALDLAMRAGDRLYAANMLSYMSRMTLLIGQNALTDHDTHTGTGARQRHLLGPGWPSPKARLPRCWLPSCMRWKDGALPCSATSGQLATLSCRPSDSTSRRAPATSLRGWASSPTPRSPRTSAAVCAPSASPSRPSR